MNSPPEQERSAPGAATDNTTSGEFASGCIRKLSRRLASLRPEVVADTDPETLHQLRVTLRRPRNVLQLFEPAPRLPKGVSAAHVAKVARHTSQTRDLDGLDRLLRSGLAPALPAKEQRKLQPVLQRLALDRTQAVATLVAGLEGGRTSTLMAQLNRWERSPRTTALGELPLRSWASEWLAPIRAGLFLEAGWFCRDPLGKSLHTLRKWLKAMRSAMEALHPCLQPELIAWREIFKHGQDHLGNLHDLRVLAEKWQGQGDAAWTRHPLPVLRGVLRERQGEHWRQWLRLRENLTSTGRRHRFNAALARIGAEDG